ncbi:MAG: hypothetical protein O2949_09235, partial [Proteobacteria bacterium]|nr:hypothetical protein [Pseudomonadota bacterium]
KFNVRFFRRLRGVASTARRFADCVSIMKVCKVFVATLPTGLNMIDFSHFFSSETFHILSNYHSLGA